MADVVIFGVRDFASLAHFYLRHDSPHRVVAFTVHREYLPPEGAFEGLPVAPFEELESRFPPDRVAAFAPMSHRQMNAARTAVYEELRRRGYTLISYVSSRATTFPDLVLGDNCFILEDNTIQPFVRVGANAMIWSGNHLGHHSTIEDHVFITSHVVISGHCTIGRSAFLGVNATIRDGVHVGEGALIGMGAIINGDVAAWSVHRGAAARAAAVSSQEIDV